MAITMQPGLAERTALRRPALSGFAGVLVGALILPLAAANAQDDPFQKELRAQNAQHLNEVAPVLRQATTSMIDTSFGDGKEQGPWELRQGDLAISVTLKRTAPIDMSAFPAPTLTVSLAGKKVIAIEGVEGLPDTASFIAQIVEMDPSNPHPEILFSSFTGGAHCCADTRIATSDKSGKTWRMVEAGLFDGGPLAATDLDGDGRFEIAVGDNRFLYRFGCYACSSAPLNILRLESGRITDVSRLEAFRDAQRDWLVTMIQYGVGGEGSNGFLAGYVGQKILLGEGRQAWDFMLKNYDRESDWGLEHCTGKRDKEGNCLGKTATLTFPEALKRFLEEAGYPLPK